MKNREIFQRDPVTAKLMNDGVATVTESQTPKEIETLRYELEHFVCEGQYKEGMIRILESYLGNVDSTMQPAAWVSGFYGSGKSHLLKMLRHFWVNTKFLADGATARGLAHLPVEVSDLFKELDTLGKRYGGLHAASGTLPSGGGVSARLAILSIVFHSKGLPESLPQAQFCLWLKRNGFYEQVKKTVQDASKDLFDELHDLYVSPVLARALLTVDPSFAPDEKQARAALRAQFPLVDDISTAEFIRTIREVLAIDGQIPCTVIVLDEIQLYIGDNVSRSTDVQEVTEALCKQLDSRVMLIGSGQTALAGSDQLLQRLMGRFTIPIQLSDVDVETVIRRVVLAKKADKRKSIEDTLKTHAGEIDRHLAGTRIGSRSEDRSVIVDDYPLLPVRRRFWEHALRAVDVPGTSSQLRTQLKIVHDAVRETAERPLGTVMAADTIFQQLQPELLRTGILLREIDETIRNLDDGTLEGCLAQRLCGLIFLIRKLPRESIADIGVRAKPEHLADLLVEDLSNDGAALRKKTPAILDKLVAEGKLIKIEDEYSLQTRESSEWDREFRNRQTRLNNDLVTISSKRSALISAECSRMLSTLRILQGRSKEPRKLLIHFGSEPPDAKGHEIPIWIRDGWGEKESTVLKDARFDGNNSPVVFLYVQKSNAADLRKAIIEYEAAKATIEIKGTPNTDEGREARDGMTTRMSSAQTTRDRIIRDVINDAKVIQGGGTERFGLDIVEKVREAAEVSLDRLFPNFKDGDDHRWSSVINRAKNGDEAALQAVDWKDAPERHPVSVAVLSEVGPGKRGKEMRDTLESSPNGWPRDAIDAVLITLFTTGHLKAIYKGRVLSIGELDQAKISVTDFRMEIAMVDAKQRIHLRKLFQSEGIACKSGEEVVKAGEFLAKMADLADRAGGDPPLPERPPTTHIDTLRGLAGNEQLIGILNQHHELREQLKDWSDRAELAAKRLPVWQTLQMFLKHAAILPEAEEARKQAETIERERRLLEKTDPVPAVHKDVASALRTALREVHSEFESIYKREMASLEANENWKKLKPAQKKEILVAEGIDSIPSLRVGDDSALLRSLDESSLRAWKTKDNALPQQFANAVLAAAKLLEPSAHSVRLVSGTLRTEEDVKNWLVEAEKKLMRKLKDGPIVIS